MSETFKVCFCCSRSFKVKTREPPLSINRLFEAYSRNGKMCTDEFVRFLSEVQGERHVELDYLQDIFHSVKHHNVFHHQGLLHLDAFYRYLLSNLNSALPPFPQVHHDMNAPISHYFLYTGHNSYLTGNQLSSRSSVEPIVEALRRGVRVIELDLWPNPAGNAVEVRHGGTLTSHEDLHKCLNAIRENAFHVSEYPVVITLEDHLPPNLQGKVAKMLRKTYGEMLFRCGPENSKHFPSPEALKRKILISTKPPKEYLESQNSQSSTTQMEKETTWSGTSNSNMRWKREYQIPEEEEESEVVGYKDLIAVHAGNCKGRLKDCLSDDPEKPRRMSMSEQSLETLVRTRGTDVVRFTQRNILRIYPKGSRLDSSNYDPLVGWTHGAQMVAFNMQGHGKQLWIMQGMFRANGGCGYLKKPRILLSTHSQGTVFDPCKKLPIKTTLRVKIHTGEGWDLDFSQTHFDQYSPPDFFVKIGIAGVRSDTVSCVTGTAMDQWLPVWNDEFLFQLSVPELALLWFKVQDYDTDTQNDFAGQTCLPVPELKSGFRAVRLYNRTGKAYKNVMLLVSFIFDPPYTFQI